MPRPEQPKPERKLDTGRGPTIYEWIERRLLSEREFILEVVGGAIRELLDEQHERSKTALQDEIRELKIELCELQTVIAELRTVIAQERKLSLPQSTVRTVN